MQQRRRPPITNGRQIMPPESSSHPLLNPPIYRISSISNLRNDSYRRFSGQFLTKSSGIGPRLKSFKCNKDFTIMDVRLECYNSFLQKLEKLRKIWILTTTVEFGLDLDSSVWISNLNPFEGDYIIHRVGKKGKISYGWLYVGMHGYIDRKISLFCWSFILNTCKHVLYEEYLCSFIIDIPFLLLICFLQPRLSSLIL
ncbi:hypothetical protein DVH24_014027 [Malus domestica]|uniref:Uncharacterized protein n=1 Tax=Malus domestica TaxID=3750 RepID=A0A498JJG9_MALDO|nr:hypothetical protein DVH24_014027 [Malus domestica]